VSALNQIHQTPHPERIMWIDSAKGIGITLVVIAHVLGGGEARGWFGDGRIARMIYDYIYLFHMPLFFTISGVLAIESMRARPRAAFDSRLRSIAWPYLLWGLIGMAIMPLISRFMSHAPTDDLMTSLWKLLTGQVSWFLWTLFVIEILILPVARAPLPLLLACSLLAYAISAKYAPFGALTSVVRNAPFFLAGCICARQIKELHISMTLLQSVGAAAVGVLLFATLGLIMSVSPDQSELLYLMGGGVGSAATIACTLAIRRRPIQKVLQSFGMASLVIFLLHPYFQGAAREFLVTLAKTDPRYAFGGIVLVALVGPWMTWQLASKFGFGWMFRLPPRRRVAVA
jgi:fucose 4-O-acetylase-like acetyltransferase